MSINQRRALKSPVGIPCRGGYALAFRYNYQTIFHEAVLFGRYFDYKRKELSMRNARLFVWISLMILLSSVVSNAQQTANTTTDLTMNRRITFSGTLTDANGQPRWGSIGLTFSIYAAQEGGDAMWHESQTVQLDEKGGYTVLIGSTEKEGLPLEVFDNGKAQWLGVEVQGEKEKPRVLLWAVPYALKAADADTLGGKPLASIVLYEDLAKAVDKVRPFSVARVPSEGNEVDALDSKTTNSSSRSSIGTVKSVRRGPSSGALRPLALESGAPYYNTTYGLGTGISLTTGSANSFFGFDAGRSNTSGNVNSFFGNGAGYSNTTGFSNSFLGYQSGYNNTTGDSNSFLGYQSGYSNTAGSSNSFLGYYAGYFNTTGSFNSFLGNYAGLSNTTGGDNSFLGYQAGFSNTTGSYNSFLGNYAGLTNTTGGDNSFLGNQAGYSNTTGSSNSFLGNQTGFNNTTGVSNSFLGYQAGYSNTTGNSNSFLGNQAGYSNTTGVSNSFIGYQAGYSNIIGFSNSFIGYQAGYNNTTGNNNSFLGYQTGLFNTTGSYNSFHGNYAGLSNTTGGGNSFIGHQAGASNTTGSSNSFLGNQAGRFNTTGGDNSFLGTEAGYSNTTGGGNSFSGRLAGFYNTTGNYNSLVGFSAGNNNTTGSSNSFFGTWAGNSSTTGDSNSFFGTLAGNNNTTGGSNSFVGASAGFSNTTENNNTFIGSSSNGAAGITNATALGYQASVTQSNSFVLGSINGVNGATADTYVGIGTTAPDRQLTVEGEQALIRFRRYYGTTDPYARTFAPALLFERARGIRTAAADITAGDYLGKLQFRGRVSGGVPDYGLFAFIASDTSQNGRFSFIDRDLITERMSILNTGNVGIGTTVPTERLEVVGNIKISGSILYSPPPAIPDYVFAPDYQLMPVKDLENYLARERHLPNVPSATEIQQKGINMSEFQMKMLEKIEELTLYTVQQAKVIEEHKAIFEQKDATNMDLQLRLAALEQTVEKLLGAAGK
jgi:hypothetical protein